MLNHLALGGFIADTIREPLLVLDAQFRVVAANQAFFASFQTTPNDTIERDLFNLGNGQWDIPELRRLLKEVLPQHKQIENFPVEHEFPRLGRRSMLLNGTEIVRPEEHEYLILLAIDDVTERRVAERALEVRTVELERSNRELEQFAAIAAHDLNEPLRKIRTYGTLLQESSDALPTDAGRDQVQRMVHAATRMQALINDLLALARISAPQQVITLDARSIVRDVLVDLESTVTAAGATVDLGPLPQVHGDPTLLRQLFQNLIANAIKFHRPGVAPRVEIAAFETTERSPTGGCLVGISVTDNGIGFDQRHAARIFEPMERLHGRSVYPGSGMGLALARRIVQRHGGTIKADGIPKAGSAFHVTLPCAPSIHTELARTLI